MFSLLWSFKIFLYCCLNAGFREQETNRNNVKISPTKSSEADFYDHIVFRDHLGAFLFKMMIMMSFPGHR